MPKMVAYHEVKDRDHWIASTKRDEVFGPLGITDIRTFIDATNPSRVAISADVPDMDAFGAFMQSPEAAAAMESDGVIPETVVVFVEA